HSVRRRGRQAQRDRTNRRQARLDGDDRSEDDRARRRMSVFTSDNAAGIHPDVFAAIARANEGRAVAYGDDVYTARAVACLRAEFGEHADAMLVWGGTAANVIGLACVTEPYHAVLCGET